MLQYKKLLSEESAMPIRALLMDIDDTLFDFRTSSREALAIAFAEHKLPLPTRCLPGTR